MWMLQHLHQTLSSSMDQSDQSHHKAKEDHQENDIHLVMIQGCPLTLILQTTPAAVRRNMTSLTLPLMMWVNHHTNTHSGLHVGMPLHLLLCVCVSHTRTHRLTCLWQLHVHLQVYLTIPKGFNYIYQTFLYICTCVWVCVCVGVFLGRDCHLQNVFVVLDQVIEVSCVYRALYTYV